MTETATPVDYSLHGPKEGQTQMIENQPNDSNSDNKEIASAAVDEFLLAEDVDTQEETEDESDEVNNGTKVVKIVWV